MPASLSSMDTRFFALPDETNGAKYPHGKRPYSVYGALRAMSNKDWKNMCKDVFNCKPDYVDIETVMTQIAEVDTCSDLGSPVNVWIDDEGYYTVSVYEADGRPEI
jgi:hypothetical protein